MRYLLPIGLLGLAAILLLATPADSLILGLDHQRFTYASLGAALLISLLIADPARAAQAPSAGLLQLGGFVGIIVGPDDLAVVEARTGDEVELDHLKVRREVEVARRDQRR